MSGSNGAVEELPKRWALKFISGKYQGGMFLLSTDREVVIGRSSETDMVLVEDMVSRKHARISIANDQIVIQDLRSTNGTFVNGEKIAKSDLHEGDRILIGTSILKLVSLESDEKIDNLAENRKLKRIMEQTSAKKSRPSSPMSGMIDEVPLPDLLQLFSTSKKSGVLIVRSNDQQGRFYMREGKIFFAAIDGLPDLEPRKAFSRIVTWSKGFFTLMAPTGEKFNRELSQTTEELLMEAMRQKDELERIRPEIPSPQTKFGLTRPMKPALGDLDKNQLEILQRVHNREQVQDILDECDLPDLEIYKQLLFLIGKSYIEVQA